MIMPYKGTLCNINTIKTVEQFVTSIKSYSILYLQRWKFFHNHHQPQDDPARLVLLGARHDISNDHHNDVRWGNSVKYPEVKGVINLEGGEISFLKVLWFHILISVTWMALGMWYEFYEFPGHDMNLVYDMITRIRIRIWLWVWLWLRVWRWYQIENK